MSKRMLELEKKVDKTKLYSIEEGVDLLKQTASAKFDETVELHVRLGINPRQSTQNVRGFVLLPHGTGKTKKVCVITKGEKLKEAEQSGADFWGSEELIDKIKNGWFEFDVLVATPDVMKDLSKLGKILGPKGLMPNPKTGTLTQDIINTVKELKKGRIEFRNDDYGIIHCAVGKVSFDKEKIMENIKAVIDALIKAKPPQAKGQYIRSISIATTMGPGIKINPSSVTK